jgi:hypothetical protein
VRAPRALAALLATLAACGADDARPAVPVESYLDELAAVTCERLFRCCDAADLADELAGFNPVPGTVAECTVAFRQLFESFLEPAVLDAVESGRAAYDQAQAVACLDAYERTACTVTFAQLEAGAACRGAVVGRVPDGSLCRLDTECLEADRDCEGGDSETLGQCVALPREGEPCSLSCVRGTYCDVAGDPAICVDQQADGTPCSGDQACESGACDGTCVTPAARCTGA